MQTARVFLKKKKKLLKSDLDQLFAQMLLHYREFTVSSGQYEAVMNFCEGQSSGVWNNHLRLS